MVSIPIKWLTHFVQGGTDPKRAEFWRQQGILRERLGPEYTEDMDEIEASIKEWDEKQNE